MRVRRKGEKVFAKQTQKGSEAYDVATPRGKKTVIMLTVQVMSESQLALKQLILQAIMCIH
jgi:hypothetical protein